jgi:uncharacterized caspase-like protein
MPSILPPLTTKTLFIGLGVTRYADTNYSLTYPGKDITDIHQLLKTHYRQRYDSVLLFDASVTKEKISRLRNKIRMLTNPEDNLIIFASGHGILSQDNTFYFAPYNMDFEHPAKNGVSIDDLLSLFSDCHAHNRLLLLDACNSGDVDKDEEQRILKVENALARKKVVSARRSKGLRPLVARKTNLSYANSFALMQDLFSNIKNNFGVTVISAAAGIDYAYEGDEWKNGVFTYCLRNGLDKNTANLNGDHAITVTELQDYVGKSVSDLTNGRQKPTSRLQNLDNNWVLWMVD